MGLNCLERSPNHEIGPSHIEASGQEGHEVQMSSEGSASHFFFHIEQGEVGLGGQVHGFVKTVDGLPDCFS